MLVLMVVFPTSFYLVSYLPTAPTGLCIPLSETQLAANVVTLSRGPTTPAYLQEYWLGFYQNFTSINYNVTAVEQTDLQGYGPAYLLNGLTDQNVWYQVGIAWKLANRTASSFEMVYKVWNASTASPLLPASGPAFGSVPMTGLSAGGKVLLSLSFGNGTVVMSTYDWGSGLRRSVAFSSFGASIFGYFQYVPSHFRSSLMVQWYHIIPYTCTSSRVVFSVTNHRLFYGWLSSNELNFTGVPPSEQFRCGSACMTFAKQNINTDFFLNNTLYAYNAYTGFLFANSTRFIAP